MYAFFPFRTIMVTVLTACMAASAADLSATNATLRVRIRPVAATPSSLSSVLAADGNLDYLLRLNAVHALRTDLSADEVNALYVLLNRKAGEDPMQPEQLNAIKDEVLTVLQKQTLPPADLANNLAAMYRDPGHDVVWQDYCIQHLGAWYPTIAESNEQAMARGILWSAAEVKGGTIAGTALLALCNLSGRPGIEKERVAAKALEVALDASCGEPARMTSLQVCARLGNRQALPEARKLVDSSASVLVRVSAIACIGTLGDAGDKPLLERQAASTDRRLRVAAESALKRLGNGG